MMRIPICTNTHLKLGFYVLIGIVTFSIGLTIFTMYCNGTGHSQDAQRRQRDLMGVSRNLEKDRHDEATPPLTYASNQWAHDELTDSKVLFITMTTVSAIFTDVAMMLERMRIDYTVHLARRPMFGLFLREDPEFAAVVFTSLRAYMQLSKDDRRLLSEYCAHYKVGMIVFVTSPDTGQDDLPIIALPLKNPTEYTVNKSSQILRITKPADSIKLNAVYKPWYHFKMPDSSSTSSSSTTTTSSSPSSSVIAYAHGTDALGRTGKYPVAIVSTGATSGERTVFFNNGFHVWVERMLFLDALFYVSRGRLNMPMERYILVDVDDTLRANVVKTPTVADIKEMLSATTRLRAYVDGFRFNLGVIGKGHDSSTGILKSSNEYLMEHKDSFLWFDHTYTHPNFIKANDSGRIKRTYADNQIFIKENKLPTRRYSYVVTPFHSGTYPVYQPAYSVWHTIGASVASTPLNTHTPALRFLPASVPRGYIFNGIKVLPRKTYWVYTDSVNLTSPEVKKRNDAVQGGAIFQELLVDVVNIYMTHYCNFAHDRMAIVILENLLKFTKRWTNLRMQTIRPTELAETFFKLYPQEKKPLWTLPCFYESQLRLWLKPNVCRTKSFPDVFIVGPDSAGTTFFSGMLHGSHMRYINKVVNSGVRFFTENYLQGVDWYVDQFPARAVGSLNLYADVDPALFTQEQGAERVYTFLPNSKIVVVTASPVQMAHDCIQDYLAEHRLDLTIRDFIIGRVSERHRHVQEQCLRSANHVTYFKQWFKFFNSQQILIIDTDELYSDPAGTMNEALTFFGFESKFERYLYYNETSGSTCIKGQDICTNMTDAGRSNINSDVRSHLEAYYNQVYFRLRTMFDIASSPLPHWLSLSRHQPSTDNA